ncbi:MAG TPA: glutathione S-transferase N-terminal domain-containing protein [Candidatus Omnitrophota bacterium]|nr:glutathione S-transferase N-terminal domain-containing protein [Candidatus Omnitrophota bacterium]
MLELYQFESCPYCRRVREKLSELEIDYIARNVRIGTPKWKEFSALNPNEQVPFLVDPDRGVSMEESAEIIGYLERVYGKN